MVGQEKHRGRSPVVASRSQVCLYLRGDRAAFKGHSGGRCLFCGGAGVPLASWLPGSSSLARPPTKPTRDPFPQESVGTSRTTSFSSAALPHLSLTRVQPISTQRLEKGRLLPVCPWMRRLTRKGRACRVSEPITGRRRLRLAAWEAVNCAPALPRWRPLRMMVVPEKWLRGTDGGSTWVFLRPCLW